ncbi:MAG: DUF177 domain-containing protein [Thermoanaerobaculia bacterium]|nr:DUF177 domain-containing protein [Thermoanaerobaculia bacterium]
MQIRLDQLEEQHFTWNESLQVDAGELSQTDVARLGEVDCTGSIDRTSDGWVVRMIVRYLQTLNCVRCLEPVEAPVELESAILLLKKNGASEIEPQDERELDREDLGVQVLEEPDIDTRELALEQMQLAVPMKPLCRESCKGLCGICGQNLNEGNCDCEPEIDPRWAALEKLKTVH